MARATSFLKCSQAAADLLQNTGVTSRSWKIFRPRSRYFETLSSTDLLIIHRNRHCFSEMHHARGRRSRNSLGEPQVF